MTTSSHSGAISPGSPINDSQPQMPPSQQALSGVAGVASNTVPPNLVHPGLLPASITHTSSTSSTSLSSTSSSAAPTPPPAKLKPTAKAPNVFTNDGSFLDRIRRSVKEEEDRRKDKDIQARKLQFADRFRSRGKRHISPGPTTPGGHSASDVTPESEGDPLPKKRKYSTSRSKKTAESNANGPMSAQEEYRNAMESYPTSLKDGGTGIRPLIK